MRNDENNDKKTESIPPDKTGIKSGSTDPKMTRTMVHSEESIENVRISAETRERAKKLRSFMRVRSKYSRKVSGRTT
jgi:hypothetical protein